MHLLRKIFVVHFHDQKPWKAHPGLTLAGF